MGRTHSRELGRRKEGITDDPEVAILSRMVSSGWFRAPFSKTKRLEKFGREVVKITSCALDM